MPRQDLGNATVSHAPLVLLRGDFLFQTRVQTCPRIGRHDIPHLGLAVALVMLPPRHRIIRMHLDGQVVASVDELDQQGKLVPVLGIHMLSHEPSLILLHELRNRPPAQGSIGHRRLMLRHPGQLPALADMLNVSLYSLV